MEKTTVSSGAYKELVNQIYFLTDQVSAMRRRIAEMAENADSAGQNADRGKSGQKKSNIISFSAPGITFDRKNGSSSDASGPISAAPGKPLPFDIFDYRPLLQRDGLILLSWDKRSTEMGDRYTAYWATSAGIPRFYASKLHSEDQFYMASPHHKSYAAEDGIEFYGQKAPEYIVLVAPELMMSNPRHRELRQNHIEILKKQGISSDFNFEFLLTKKNRGVPLKKSVKSGAMRTG